jgi:hypothetical protein
MDDIKHILLKYKQKWTFGDEKDHDCFCQNLCKSSNCRLLANGDTVRYVLEACVFEGSLLLTGL